MTKRDKILPLIGQPKDEYPPSSFAGLSAHRVAMTGTMASAKGGSLVPTQG